MSVPSQHGHGPKNRKEVAALSLGALGVVYGDIGTSPLYAMKEGLSSDPQVEHAIRPLANGMSDRGAVLGILSLFFWSLTLVVCVKYLVFVLRADNKGEGGTMSLAAL